MSGMNTTTAHVTRDSQTGELTLHDPAAAVMMQAVAKHNCKATLAANVDRVAYFVDRVASLGRSPDDVVIVIINVDTQTGRPLADALMPGADWQPLRDAGQVPFARGLAVMTGVQKFVALIDADEAKRMQQGHGKLMVVVVDHETVAVFEASSASAI